MTQREKEIWFVSVTGIILAFFVGAVIVNALMGG